MNDSCENLSQTLWQSATGPYLRTTDVENLEPDPLTTSIFASAERGTNFTGLFLTVVTAGP